jgi:hypothetical protein
VVRLVLCRIANPENISTARQRHDKNVFAVTNNHATEEFLEAMLSMRSVPRPDKRNQLEFSDRRRVEEGSNTSTVTLRDAECDEKGTQCMFLGDIIMGTWPSRLGESRI